MMVVWISTRFAGSAGFRYSNSIPQRLQKIRLLERMVLIGL